MTARPAERSPRTAAPAALLLAAALAAAAGCASHPAPAEPPAAAAAARPVSAAQPAAGPEESAARPAAEVAEATPPAPLPGNAADGSAGVADDPTVVTIEPPGGRAAEPRTLAEAAQAARARRGERPKASTVITNDNLAEWAAGGQVTLAPDPAADPAAAGAPGAEAGSGPGGAPGGAATAAAGEPGGEPGSGAADPAAGPRDEVYWRERARDLRTRWAAAAEEIERLEKEAADLRWAFYAEDDPYYRDERIKPSWDRALDDLRRARQDERHFRDQVEELMEEGRRAGALPGWLREGVELEPDDAADSDAPIGREPRSTEPIEPPTTPDERPR